MTETTAAQIHENNVILIAEQLASLKEWSAGKLALARSGQDLDQALSLIDQAAEKLAGSVYSNNPGAARRLAETAKESARQAASK